MNADIAGNENDEAAVEMEIGTEITVNSVKSMIKSQLIISQPEEKEDILSQSPYFRVEVSILCGRELIAMDRGGTSDPYVRIMQGEEQLHKTVEKKKTVNPVWNDQSNVYIENPLIPLTFQVSN